VRLYLYLYISGIKQDRITITFTKNYTLRRRTTLYRCYNAIQSPNEITVYQSVQTKKEDFEETKFEMTNGTVNVEK